MSVISTPVAMRNPYGAYLASNPASAKSFAMFAQRQQEQAEMDYAHKIVEEIALPESRQFVATYPVDSFGRLSVDPEMLARIHAKFYYRFDNLVPDNDRLAEVLDSVWSVHAQEYLDKNSLPLQFEYHDRALAVLRVIWANTPNDPMHTTATAEPTRIVGSSFGSETWFARYSFLYSCPEAIPYFEVGLFDIDMVKNAIANGIDPSILASAVEL